jgi:hypothetical protein
MLSLNRRAVLAVLGANLLAGPVSAQLLAQLLAQGRADAPVGVTGPVFLHENGGVPALTTLGDAKWAMVTSHIGEGASRLGIGDGQSQPHAAIELQCVFRDVAKRAAAAPLVLAGHGEPASPTDQRGLVDLEAVKPLLAANIGKPDQTKAVTDDIAKAFPAYPLPPLLAHGSSRALRS